jgi:hypothetical protein
MEAALECVTSEVKSRGVYMLLTSIFVLFLLDLRWDSTQPFSGLESGATASVTATTRLNEKKVELLGLGTWRGKYVFPQQRCWPLEQPRLTYDHDSVARGPDCDKPAAAAQRRSFDEPSPPPPLPLGHAFRMQLQSRLG